MKPEGYVCSCVALKELSMVEGAAGVSEVLLKTDGSGRQVMKWMGVRLTQCDLESGAEGSGVRGFWGFPPPQTALLRHVPHPEEDLAALMELMADTVADVERALGYTFVDRSFLLQAVTHASYYRNRYEGASSVNDALPATLCFSIGGCGAFLASLASEIRQLCRDFIYIVRYTRKTG